MSHKLILLLLVALIIAVARPNFAADFPPITRILPPAGIEITAAQRDRLTAELNQFNDRASSATGSTPALLPDVLIYAKAVQYALDHGEFFKPTDVDGASELLQVATARAKELLAGKASWTKQTGMVVRGYQSAIDNSYQPYGLVIPEGLDLTKPAPLYVWLHGRNDKGTDLQFILERQKSRGEFAPDDGIVLHPLGRYCNAFKFAGERDVLEAIASVQSRYKIDPRRIVMMGFSMGGAGAWHLGAHYPSRWVAMQAGAGFVDTRLYQNLQGDSLPTPNEQKLWHLYDVPSYTRNLFNIPVISYSGELDKQKASADIMEAEYKKHGEKLHRIIGAKMGHKYDAASKTQIVKELQAAHRTAKPHDKFTFQTRTLRYNHAYWVDLTGLERHWDDTRIEGEFKRTPDGGWQATLTTKNVTALRITGPNAMVKQRFTSDERLDERLQELIRRHGEIGKALARQTDKLAILRLERLLAGISELIERLEVALSADRNFDDVLHAVVDGQTLVLTSRTKRSVRPTFELVKTDNKWQQPTSNARTDETLHKLPGLQGPIDDAFMDGPVLFVSPSGKSPHAKVNAWVDNEMRHQRDRWRRLFRGDMPTKKDSEVTADDIARCNLVLWGDPTSNALLSKINAELPVRWNDDQQSPGIQVGRETLDAKHHMLAMIYPNPLNPAKYVVLNSGPTFRETHDKSNAMQTAKLPDWAVIDLDTPPSGTAPGRIVDAGFFDESWQLQTARANAH